MEDTQFDISLYNDEFFAWHKTHAEPYSLVNMDWLLQSKHCTQKYDVKNVCDVGCGIGSYIQKAADHNKRIRGYEIALDYAQKYMRDDVVSQVRKWDFTQELTQDILETDGKYDLVMSFETAEHIEPSGSETFVKNLINLTQPTGMIVFTAGPPGQEGCGHINCRDKQFWIELFEQNGWDRALEIQWDIASNWRAQGCPNYIADNLLVLMRPSEYASRLFYYNLQDRKNRKKKDDMSLETYSQNNEDEIVAKIFSGCNPETLTVLDIGANDGQTFSNSYALILQGWNAHLLEPSVKAYALLKQLHSHNPKVNIYGFGIAEKTAVMEFHESGSFEGKGQDIALLSCINPKEKDRWAGKVEFTPTQAHFYTFEDFIKNIPNPRFDFISIDAEGHDITILKQINLDKVLCRCLCIEYNSISANEIEIDNLVTPLGFKLISKNAENLIYAR